MGLRATLWMIIAPLALATGGVLLFTPADILRQPVLGTTEARAPVRLPVEADEITTASIQPAFLTVVASPVDLRRPVTVDVARLPVTEEPVSVDSDRRWITASALNLRTGPGTANGVVASLTFGTPVTVLEQSGSWAHVEADGVTGWLSANFLGDAEPVRD